MPASRKVRHPYCNPRDARDRIGPGVLRELAEAEKLTPHDFDVFYLRGKVLALMNQYKEAETAFRRAMALRPTEPGPHYQLGLVYRKSGQETRARQEFDLVEHLKQSAPPTYVFLHGSLTAPFFWI